MTEEVVLIGNHSTNTNDEWYTPIEFVDAARRVMGSIDVDPASCDAAQEYIQAKEYYTIDNSSLKEEINWEGNVWMNPPYSRVIKQFINKLYNEVDEGITKQAIVLTNNGTDTKWFHQMASKASAICLVRGRIAFMQGGVPVANNNKGQIFTYIGDNVKAFTEEFSKFGKVYLR